MEAQGGESLPADDASVNSRDGDHQWYFWEPWQAENQMAVGHGIRYEGRAENRKKRSCKGSDVENALVEGD